MTFVLFSSAAFSLSRDSLLFHVCIPCGFVIVIYIFLKYAITLFVFCVIQRFYFICQSAYWAGYFSSQVVQWRLLKCDKTEGWFGFAGLYCLDLIVFLAAIPAYNCNFCAMVFVLNELIPVIIAMVLNRESQE